MASILPDRPDGTPAASVGQPRCASRIEEEAPAGGGTATDTLALVSATSDEFRLELPLETAFWACREAVAAMDWHLESIEPNRLVLKRSFGFLNMSDARIEVLLSAGGPDATTITLLGKLSWGIGRWDMRTLRSLMNTVRNAVEVAARRVH
jgi:hypothetical protein